MIDTQDTRAFSEVLDIINHMDNQLTKKIPTKLIKLLEENCINEQDISLNYNKKLVEMKLHPNTLKILSVIYLNYLCSETEKNDFIEILNENERKYQEEQKEKYSYDNLFKSLNKEQIEPESDIQTNAMVVYKKNNFFSNLLTKLKNFLGINKK